MNQDVAPNRNNASAAFLLVIPGCVLIGLGVGLAAGVGGIHAITGLGAGLLTWGVIVATGMRR